MNLAELKNTIDQYSNTVKLHPDYMFRGQADSSWNLEPSFTRLVNKRNLNRVQALQLERECVNKFSISASKMLPLDKTIELILARSKSPEGGGIDFIGWSVVMQSFSAPTRQLDWTMSPWVALYFACCEREDCDGAIWIADFYKVSNYAEKKLNGGDFQSLLVDPVSQDVVVFAMPYVTHERLEAQQGRFSISTNPLSNHETELSECDGLIKIDIPKEFKQELLRDIYQMNITAKTLFPGIDGLGKSIYEYCYLWDETSIIT